MNHLRSIIDINRARHYNDVIMNTMTSQITSLTIVYSTVYKGADQKNHQSSASLAFVWGIHRGPVKSPHKGPVTRKMFPFDDVIMWRIDAHSQKSTTPEQMIFTSLAYSYRLIYQSLIGFSRRWHYLQSPSSEDIKLDSSIFQLGANIII